MATTMKEEFAPKEAVEASIERFRALRASNKEQWIELLNNIRYFELRGSGYLSYLAEVLDDPDMMAKMTKHAADEGKHAHFLNLMIRREGGKPKSLAQQNSRMGFSPPTSGCPSREELIGVFAAMQAIEKRAAIIFCAFEEIYADDPVILSMVREVIKDERFHIGWIAKVLDQWKQDEALAGKIDAALQRATSGYQQQTS